MSFKISEKTGFETDSIERLGSKFLTGNGYLGLRGTCEEFTKAEKTAMIVSGLYDRRGGKWREPVNAPNGCYLSIAAGRINLHYGSCKVSSHVQTLRMDTAVHERKTEFELGGGATATVRGRRFVSADNRYLTCIEYRFTVSKGGPVAVTSGIDGDVWDLNGPHLEKFKAVAAGGALQLSALTQESKVPVTVTELTVFKAVKTEVVRRPDGIMQCFSFHAEPDKVYTLVKFTTVHTGLDSNNPQAAGLSACTAAKDAGFRECLERHAAVWKKRWQECDVGIEGDVKAQLAIRFSLYHLLSIMPVHSDKVSIPARGLSGQVYKGAIFWDTEIFMLPFFTHAFPSIARNLLMYRYHTLDGARRKAREYGFEGAFFAWESQDSGDDACTLFNIEDVFTGRPMRTYFRDKQYHISGDIPYAIMRYIEVTGDRSILVDGAAEVIFECARFFASCAYYKPHLDRYEILDVTGPDEYHERVHNNQFTNLMAAHALDACLKVEESLEHDNPGFLIALKKLLRFGEWVPLIRTIREKLYLPAPDQKTGILPQFDGYFALEDLPLKTLLKRKLHKHEYLGGGNGLALPTRIIKQADVILAMVLFGDRFSQAVKGKNWDFYEARTEHGSSLSACAYSLIAAETGRAEAAYRYFLKTAMTDLTGDAKQYVGTLYIGGTHPAANGGAWMAAVTGFCGIRYARNELSIEQRLPAGWNSVRVPLKINGFGYSVKVSREEIRIQADTSPDPAITIQVEKNAYTFGGRNEIRIDLKNQKPQGEPANGD